MPNSAILYNTRSSNDNETVHAIERMYSLIQNKAMKSQDSNQPAIHQSGIVYDGVVTKFHREVNYIFKRSKAAINMILETFPKGIDAELQTMDGFFTDHQYVDVLIAVREKSKTNIWKALLWGINCTSSATVKCAGIAEEMDFKGTMKINNGKEVFEIDVIIYVVSEYVPELIAEASAVIQLRDQINFLHSEELLLHKQACELRLSALAVSTLQQS
jgi:hypothetical protein